jgi:hypothetical protein
MTKVKIIVELTIDDDMQYDIDTILTEMDYNFSFLDENEDELIIKTEILEQI